MDTSNKVFTFEASDAGEYFISFVVSDHNGELGAGLMKVNVAGFAKLWSDIYFNGQKWLGPLTVEEALDK
ncbi:hypothetical protein FCV62_22675, partial [Vibrio kanaloae]